MKDKIKNQHYVPSSYLRLFSENPNSEQIHVFDKFGMQSFKANVSKVATERFFYDLPKEMEEKLKVKQFIEKSFDPLENKTSQILKRLLDDLETKNFTGFLDNRMEDKICLSFLLVYQLFRTKEFREDMSQFWQKSQIETGKAILKLKDPSIEREVVCEISEDSEHVLHAKFLLDYEKIESFARGMANHFWVIVENTSRFSFLTSDAPVAMINHHIQPTQSGEGFLQYGIEISFPLSPKFLLILLEKKYFYGAAKLNDKVIKVSDARNIKFYNFLQIMSSSRFLFSNQGNFEMMSNIKKRTPELFDKDRARFEVEEVQHDSLGKLIHHRKPRHTYIMDPNLGRSLFINKPED